MGKNSTETAVLRLWIPRMPVHKNVDTEYVNILNRGVLGLSDERKPRAVTDIFVTLPSHLGLRNAWIGI